MTDPSKRADADNGKQDDAGDAELDARLSSLDERLKTIDTQRKQEARLDRKTGDDQKALGTAFKLSAEFVSGVLAGAIVGWLVDRLSGWSPWGLVVFLLLGFCAGMLNLFRAAGVWNRPGKKNDRNSS